MKLTVESVHPTGHLVLARALFQDQTESGLWIPPEAQDRYPNIAEVTVIGPDCHEDIRPEDIIILSTEMYDVENTYLDCFQVVLRDGDEDLRILVDFEVEPLFKEQFEKYEASPGSEDRWIQLMNLEDDLAYRFLASDVLEWGPADLQASSFQKLRYVETRMFPIGDDVYYLTHEAYIEGVIRASQD